LRGSASTWATEVEPNLPGWTITMILTNPEGYLDHVLRLAKRVNRSAFNPMPELVL